VQSEIQEAWRNGLIIRLRKVFGLMEEEARMKVDAWLQSISNDARRSTTIEANAGRGLPYEKRSRARSRRNDGVGVSKSRSATQ
jgi:hypothetical protein